MNDKIHKILDAVITVGSFFSPKTIAFKLAKLLGIIKPALPRNKSEDDDEHRDKR